MKTLKDYLAYARSYVNPRISERAGMSSVELLHLIQVVKTFWWNATSPGR